MNVVMPQRLDLDTAMWGVSEFPYCPNVTTVNRVSGKILVSWQAPKADGIFHTLFGIARNDGNMVVLAQYLLLRTICSADGKDQHSTAKDLKLLCTDFETVDNACENIGRTEIGDTCTSVVHSVNA
jgi:hypothetical protein